MYALHDTPALRVLYEPGTQDTAVFSFTGVGLGLSIIQKEEFAQSLHDAGVAHQIVYIIDQQRTWYNACADDVLGVLGQVTPKVSRVTTLGNSMGGFAALYFASRIDKCKRAIAFSPQFAVSPNHMPPGEGRWSEYLTNISAHPIAHALEGAASGIDYFIFYGANDKLDRRHAERFMELRGLSLNVFMIEGCDHHVARYLRERGCLHAILSRLITNSYTADELALTLDTFKVGFTRWQAPA